MIMDSQEFTNLYTKQNFDEAITSFQNEAGFSLIRLYPEGTPYHKDGRRMFMKVAVLERGFFYGVDMTRPEKRGETTDYVITDGNEYRKKVTNFMSDGGEFVFDEANKRIVHQKTNKSLTLNEFVDILEANHLADRLFWKRILNFLADSTLKIIFLLSDKQYEKIRVAIDKYNFSRDNKPIPAEKHNIEPFFKYFYISKNLIFGILLVTFIIAILVATFPNKLPIKSVWHSFFGEFTLSNPMVVLLFFLGLFSSEKLSKWLNRKIKEFLMPDKNNFYNSQNKENFVEKLHNFQYQNKFNLRISLRPPRIKS
jgi:hypothetical protein